VSEAYTRESTECEFHFQAENFSHSILAQDSKKSSHKKKTNKKNQIEKIVIFVFVSASWGIKLKERNSFELKPQYSKIF
jgi:hypothetical protein